MMRCLGMKAPVLKEQCYQKAHLREVHRPSGSTSSCCAACCSYSQHLLSTYYVQPLCWELVRCDSSKRYTGQWGRQGGK